MEDEHKTQLTQTLLEEAGRNFRAFLAELSPEDRWRLTNTLYTLWAENRRKDLEEGTKVDDSLIELAWCVHP